MSQIVATAELAKQIAEASGPIQIVSASDTMLAVRMPPQLSVAAVNAGGTGDSTHAGR